jgi:hypothetical protein
MMYIRAQAASRFRLVEKRLAGGESGELPVNRQWRPSLLAGEALLPTGRAEFALARKHL